MEYDEEFEVVSKQLKQVHSNLDMRRNSLTDEVNTLEVSIALIELKDWKRSFC